MACETDDPPLITEEEIISLNYRRGIRLLIKLKVDTSQMRTLDDIQRFLRLRYLYKENHMKLGFRSMKQPLEDDRNQRQALMEICEDIEATLGSGCNTDMNEVLQHIDTGLGGEKWEQHLNTLRERLSKQHTPILVAGETGCGKSSLINLLLGERLLPEAEHPCTAVICTVRHGSERVVRLKKRAPEEEGKSTSFQDDEICLKLGEPGAKQTEEEATVWEEFIKNRDDLDSGNQSSKRAHFESPLPMIGCDSVYFVDSPGIREGRILDEVMLKYLPECAAAIVVFMSDNCGGFNESVERFLRLLRQQFDQFNVALLDAEEEPRKTRSTPSADSVLFVFNRWDKVADYETADRTRQLRRNCLERLSRLWPSEVAEGRNVFFMSVSKIFSMTEQQAHAPEEFRQFQSALTALVPRCLKARLEASAAWVERLLRNVLDVTRSKINFARRDDQEKHQEEQKLRNLISQMTSNYDIRLQKLEESIKKKKTDLVKELLEHLQSKEALTRMQAFKQDAVHYGSIHEEIHEVGELPDGDNFETVGGELQIFFLKRIDREIRFWNERDAIEIIKTEDGGMVRRVNQQLTRFGRFQKCVIADCRSTFDDLEKEAQLLNELLSSDPSAGLGLDSRDPLGGQGKSQFLSNLEKVFFGMTAVIWVPLVLVGGAISFPVIAGFVVHDKRGNQQKLRKYKANKEELAGKWLANYVRYSFKEELLDNLIYDMLLTRISKVQHSVRQFIPLARLKFLERLKNLSEEKRNLSQVRRIFTPILGKVENMLQNFYGFHAQYLKQFVFTKSDFRNLRENPISMGAFGDIYAALCTKLNRRVAVKIIKTPVNKGSALDIYTEEIAWWRLCTEQHRNILKLYGLALLEDLRVGFVMDLCDGTLQDLLRNNPKLVPHQQKTKIARLASFRQTLDLTLQLTDGLACVHKANYIHRDLKMENVLFNRSDAGYVLKLCDFGLSKGKTEVTTTTAGTTLYMSPEVLQQQGCSKASDIYALGVIFWEMYYGMQAFLSLSQECGSIFALCDAIRDGKAKLDFPKKDDFPPVEYQDLIKKCVSYEWRDRLEIIQVKSQLMAIQSSTSNAHFFHK